LPLATAQEVAMKNREHDGDQQDAQKHAEGQYGDRARAANRDRIHHSEDQADGQSEDPSDSPSSTEGQGRHRLDEDRQQHDEADKNSEKNRARDR
jgi:hypothetical protein